MLSPLNQFLRQFVGVVAAALIPVIAVAFLSMPYSIGGHPGEAPHDVVSGKHWT